MLSWDGVIRANVISSQLIHERYGGVVPEIASRRHLELIDGVLDEALARAGVTLDDVDLVAATRGPGLVAALLVGFSAAKALAAARRAAVRRRSTTSAAMSPPASWNRIRSSLRS